jgi:hypothetical protein
MTQKDWTKMNKESHYNSLIKQDLENIQLIKKQITALLSSYASKAHTSGSCGELGDSFMAIDSDNFSDIADELYENIIKQVQHHKETTIGLYATDKEPDKLFEEVFVNLIEEIEMDGNKTFSAVDYEYYRDIFNKGIKLLMWRIS